MKGHCIDSQSGEAGAGTPSECVQGLRAGLKARASERRPLRVSLKRAAIVRGSGEEGCN